MQLKAYGGTGYSFIRERFLPEMRSPGVSEEHIRMMMVQNPARVLTFAEPNSWLPREARRNICPIPPNSPWDS